MAMSLKRPSMRRIYVTSTELRRMVATLYQQRGNPKIMIEEHRDIILSDIASCIARGRKWGC